MRKRLVFLIAGCIAAGSVLLSGCSSSVSIPDVIQVQNAEEAGSRITLNTTETVKVVPDMAEIIFGITTEDSDAVQCQADNTENVNRLLEYLKSEGVEERSISTSGFSLDPRYDWSGNKQTLIGYSMRTQVTVTDIPMERTGAMLTKGVEQGANEIISVSYFASTYDEAYEEALAKAVELARSKAEALAAAGGKKAGEILNIQEYGDNQYGRYVTSDITMSTRAVKEDALASGAMDMGVMPGEMEVEASISVEFALIPAE